MKRAAASRGHFSIHRSLTTHPTLIHPALRSRIPLASGPVTDAGAPPYAYFADEYVRTTSQKQGIGALLLSHLRKMANNPVLIGTWADAAWAIRFYERYGFQIVPPDEKHRLFKKYWPVPDRQIETSVVLADPR